MSASNNMSAIAHWDDIPWVVAVGKDADGDIQWEGSGFLVTPTIILTCFHVIKGYPECTVVRLIDGRVLAAIWRLSDSNKDICILELEEAVGVVAPIGIGFPFAIPENTAKGSLHVAGFPGRGDGEDLYVSEVMGPVSCEFHEQTVVRVKLAGSALEGQSGGPVIAIDQNRPVVVGMIVLGGERSPIAAFHTSEFLIDTLFGLDCGAAMIKEWHKGGTRPVAPQTIAEKWLRNTDFPGSLISIDLTSFFGDAWQLQFQLIAPSKGKMFQQPIFLQQTVMPCVRTSHKSRALHDIAPANALRLAAELSRLTGIEFRLPVYEEWIAGMTTYGTTPLPRRYAARPPKHPIQRQTSPIDSGICPPPDGLFEMVAPDAASRAINCFAPYCTRANEPDQIVADLDTVEELITFRLAFDPSPQTPMEYISGALS